MALLLRAGTPSGCGQGAGLGCAAPQSTPPLAGTRKELPCPCPSCKPAAIGPPDALPELGGRTALPLGHRAEAWVGCMWSSVILTGLGPQSPAGTQQGLRLVRLPCSSARCAPSSAEHEPRGGVAPLDAGNPFLWPPGHVPSTCVFQILGLGRGVTFRPASTSEKWVQPQQRPREAVMRIACEARGALVRAPHFLSLAPAAPQRPLTLTAAT